MGKRKKYNFDGLDPCDSFNQHINGKPVKHINEVIFDDVDEDVSMSYLYAKEKNIDNLIITYILEVNKDASEYNKKKILEILSKWTRKQKDKTIFLTIPQKIYNKMLEVKCECISISPDSTGRRI